jgi:hypothetical protein
MVPDDALMIAAPQAAWERKIGLLSKLMEMGV